MTKKIIAIMLTLIFSTTFFVKCDMDQKRKKNIAIIAYSILTAYSAKKAYQSLLAYSIKYFLTEDCFLIPVKGVVPRKTFSTFYNIFYLAKFSLYSFLTFFSIKNIIQEIRNKKTDKKENSLESQQKTILAKPST